MFGTQYKETTNGVTVGVQVVYIGSCFAQEQEYFIWAYTVDITNGTQGDIQLLGRTWEIIDERGLVTKVDGDNVFGKNPVLKHGEVFEYTSGNYLKTSSGAMKGSYEFIDLDSGAKFSAKIPLFFLDGIGKKVFH